MPVFFQVDIGKNDCCSTEDATPEHPRKFCLWVQRGGFGETRCGWFREKLVVDENIRRCEECKKSFTTGNHLIHTEGKEYA